MSISKSQLRQRIIRRLQKMQAELKQVIVDKRWWNTTRLNEQPFDLGWDLVMLLHTDEQLDAWERNDMQAVADAGIKMASMINSGSMEIVEPDQP